MSEQLSSDPAMAQRLRRFTVRLKIGFILGVNTLFLAGLWASGLDLDRVFEKDLFDPVRDVCLRLAWYKPVGEKDPIRLCKEWINLSDPSGKVHEFNKDTEIVKGADGRVYAKEATGDGRVIGLLLFVVAIIMVGMRLQRYLIARYQARLMAESNHS